MGKDAYFYLKAVCRNLPKLRFHPTPVQKRNTIHPDLSGMRKAGIMTQEEFKQQLLKDIDESLSGSGISRKWVLSHIWGTIMKYVEEATDQVSNQSEKPIEALKAVMEWIDGWEPEFTDDPEWEETNDLVNFVLKNQ